MSEDDVLKKRGGAVWYKEHVGDTYAQLAVFLGTDLNGQPIIQIPLSEAKVVGWDRLSEPFYKNV